MALTAGNLVGADAVNGGGLGVVFGCGFVAGVIVVGGIGTLGYAT